MDTCVQKEKKVNTISKIILSFFFPLELMTLHDHEEDALDAEY